MAPDTGWTTTAGDERWTVRVHGELDIDTAPRLRHYVDEQLTRCSAPVLALDLTAVNFCDSSGLGALTGALREAQALDRRLPLVVEDGGRVHRLLTLAGVLEVFDVEPAPVHPLPGTAADHGRRRSRA